MAFISSNMSDRELEGLNLKRCPFNRNHIVRVTRFQKHVIDCRLRINESDRQNFKNCPFNASHWVPTDDYKNHLICCTDNKPILREFWFQNQQIVSNHSNGTVPQSLAKVEEEETKPFVKEEKKDPKVELKDELLIDFNDNIKVEVTKEEIADKVKEEFKGEVKGENVKPKINVSKEEEDDWYDPKAKEYIIYQKPGSTTAEDFINDEKYMFENKGIIDKMSLSHLSWSERKRLNQMLIKKQKEEANRPPIKKNVNPHLDFHPILKVVEQNEKSAKIEVSYPLLDILKQRAQAKKAQTANKPTVQSIAIKQEVSLYQPLHSVNRPVNYRRIAISEAECGQENKETVVAKALRRIDLSKDVKEENMEVLVVPEAPFRIPRTNPFSGRLRKPKTMIAFDSGAAPGVDFNNN